jgi:hypothetical protein
MTVGSALELRRQIDIHARPILSNRSDGPVIQATTEDSVTSETIAVEHVRSE